MNKKEMLEELAKSIIWVCDNKYPDKTDEQILADAFRELKCFGIKAKAILNLKDN